MNRPRLPVIAGLSAGAGTSTLAAALHAIDGGLWTGGPVDVLVCHEGDDLTSLPAVPVLAVRADGPAPAPGPGGAVVVLPDVAAWRGEDATRTAARQLGVGPGRRPPDLRGYAEALVAVVGALLRSGVLDPVSGPRVPPPPRIAPPGHRPATGVPRPEPPRWASRPQPVRLHATRPRTDRPPVLPDPTARPHAAQLRSRAGQPDGLRQDAPPPRPDAAHAAPPQRARRSVVIDARARPQHPRPPGADGPLTGPPGAEAEAPPVADPGLPRLVRSGATPTVPVLLHRAEPVRPRLVAGRAVRIAPAGPPDVPPTAGRRLRIAPAAAPPVAPEAIGEGTDDDTIDGDTIDGAGHPVPGPALRTG